MLTNLWHNLYKFARISGTNHRHDTIGRTPFRPQTVRFGTHQRPWTRVPDVILDTGVAETIAESTVTRIKQFADRSRHTAILEFTCHVGSHCVTCHPAEMTLQHLSQPKLALDLATPEGCKAELT